MAVSGELSDFFEIMDMIFQGTVLGPPLWNTFFADVAIAASATGGSEAMFADDLNVFRRFPRDADAAHVHEKMQECRHDVHAWGKRNRVSFDPGKEHLLIIHPTCGDGDTFRLLGCMTDCKLSMVPAIDSIMTQIKPKITAILRTRAHYSCKDLIGQFKTHVWGIIEAHNGGIFHAASSHLDRIERAQQHFLDELGVSAEEAFLEYNFAPPILRRNIGILGMIHKRVLGIAHPAFSHLLPWYQTVNSN